MTQPTNAPTLIHLWNHLPGNYWVIDKAFKLIAISDGYLNLLSEERHHMVGKHIDALFRDKPHAAIANSVGSLKMTLEKVKTTARQVKMTVNNSHFQDGFELRYLPVLAENGAVEHIIHEAKVIHTEAPEKQRSRAELLQEEQAKLLELMAKGSPLNETLSSLCRSVSRISPGTKASVLITNEEHKAFSRAVAPEISPSFGKELESVPINDPAGGACGEAAFHGKPAICQDIARDGKWPKEWRDLCLAHGVCACYSEPVPGNSGMPLGSFMLCFSEPRKPDKWEQRLAEFGAHLTSIALKHEQAQMTMHKSDAQLYALFNQVIGGIAETSLDGTYTLVNDRYANMLGYSREELLTMRLQDVTHQDDLPLNLKKFRQMIATGKSFELEKRYIRKDGTILWVHNSVSLIAGTNGKPKAAVSVSIDISERKQNELTNALLSAVVKGSDDAIVTKGLDGIIKTWNEGARRLFGYTAEEAIGQSITLVIPPDRYKEEEQILKKLRQGKSVDHFETIRRHKNGSQLNISLTISPIHDAAGKIIGASKIARDITQRKRAEEGLRQNEQHLRMILESARDYAIISLDLNRKVMGWNPGAERLLGYTAEEIKGKSADIIFVPEDREKQAPEKEMKEAIEKGSAENERWHLRKDGSRFWGSGRSMPLRDTKDRISGFLKIMRDDTERMTIEENLKKAKGVAEQAARAKEEFLAHMSHEIRTPLNAIVGLSNLLLKSNPRKDQEESLHTLKFSSENLMTLINDILDFSKIEAGKVTLDETPFDLYALVNSLENAYKIHVQEKDIGLRMKVEEQVPRMVKGDQLKLSQVLHNLLSNAIKFTHQGSVTLQINLSRRKKGRVWLDFSVLDTGIGISREKQALIFEKFTQADTSTMRQYGGTGLGLAISKMLLQLMGSSIQLESWPGKGTCFFFRLELKTGAFVGQLPEAETGVAKNFDLGNTAILVVEDVDINRMLLSKFIEKWGGAVPDEAANGKEALEKIKQRKYDLVLMDIRMPEMDGYEAAQKIRQLPGDECKNLPIIALTADTRENFRKDPKTSCFDDIIIKPFDPDDLQQKVIRYVSKARAQRSQAVPSLPHSRSATAPEPGFSGIKHKKIREFLRGDIRVIKTYYEKASHQLQENKAIFRESMTERDVGKLDGLHHKMKVLIALMALKDLKAVLQKSATLLKANTPADQLEQAMIEGEVVFDKTGKAMDAYREKLNIRRDPENPAGP